MGWVEKKTIDGLPYYYNSDTEEITWDKPEVLMSPAEREDEAGNWVWIPHQEKLWQVGKILSNDSDGSFVVEPRDGKPFSIPGNKKVQLTDREVDVQFWPVKLSQLNRPEEHLVQMRNINDASIINNIRIRYEKDELYTWVGAAHSVLISVNPYKSLPLYGPKQIELYRNKPPNTHFKPHVYDIANNAYNSLLFDNQDQSILISGESGAGKTVCTKQCLNFLAQVAGSEQSDIEEKILLANPLLEAFGNAQTIRNNNSSRFGKWIEVFFDPMERKICSARITNYLLEKSRLVTQAKNERNYHIFYQLTTDATSMKNYDLQPPQHYHYTNQSGLYKAHLIDDAEDFAKVKEAFGMLNFSNDEQEFVLSTTAGILTLGNCSFKVKKEKEGVTGSELENRQPMKVAAGLLGFEEADLEKVLSYRSITVRGQTSTIPLDPAKATSAKDSFAMGIYSRLFDFLVAKINQSLEGKTGKFIGILDIFGFEIFEQNSFEQLCINFANEKLQQQFNNTTFKEEEALYQSEEIKYTPIQFYDNKPVLDMIELKPKGILPLLDDESLIPEGSDIKFMSKMEDAHLGNGKFLTDTHRKLKDNFNFEIVHYAGVVKYNGEKFMQKNVDNLFQDMYDLCGKNQNKIFASMFPTVDRRQMKSLSYQFRKQLDTLMQGLYKTESRYIRCIKPNGQQRPKAFNSFLCIDQLRYSGVFEAVEIRKQGYPFRYTFAQFACRYSCINRNHRYKSGPNSFKQRAQEILKVSKQDFSGCVFGKSMVLFKTFEFSTLELLRNLALETLIPVMQKMMRGHLAREMRRRCLKLDATLKQALKVQNDLALTNKAIDAVQPTLAHFMSLFPGVLPWHYNDAVVLKKKLDEWVVLEKELDRLMLQDPNKVYYELAHAVKKADGFRKKGYPETESQAKLYAEAVHARENCTLGKIDLESEACLEVLDLARMAKVRADAAQYDHKTETINRICEILDMSEIDIVKLELAKAKEMNDETRQIHREIRLFHLELEQDSAKFASITQYSKLKSPMDYAKGAMFGKQKKADTMMVFTKAPTSSSLTQLQAQGPDLKALVKIVKAISKQVRQFMGDKKLKATETANEMAAAIVNQVNGASNGLVEEAYIQVIKQIREHPVPENKSKGYELIAVLLGSVLPETELLKRVILFLSGENQEIQKFNAIWHETKYGKKVKGRDATGVANIIEELRSGQGRSKFSVTADDPTGPHI